MAFIKNNRILKYLLMMVVSLLLVLNISIGVLAISGYDRHEADACITISERLSVKGESGTGTDIQVSKRNTPNQDALIQLAKEAKKNGGATYEDAEILIDWAKEYDVPYHEIEVHPNRPGAASNVPHFHIGKTGHIPIVGEIPSRLKEALYDN